MSSASRSRFVYVTYIRTTAERLWEALTDQRFISAYWFGIAVDCAWKQGSPWRMTYPDGRVTDTGEILEIDPPRRIVIRWRNEWKPELKAEGPSRCTFTLEPAGRAIKLTVTHEIDRDGSQLIDAVANGWPLVLSNLKSLLETGEVVLTEK